jgi:hypothetical protein
MILAELPDDVIKAIEDYETDRGNNMGLSQALA